MHNNDAGTKNALLAAAVRVFADKGYSAATVREICGLAQANVAAVNYHFGGKEPLYRSVLEHIFVRVQAEQNRADLKRNPDASPEERLEAYIRQKVEDIYNSDNDGGPVAAHWAIFLMEVANPSTNLDFLVEHYVQAPADELRSIVADILQTPPTDPVVLNCALSIWGQLLDPLVMMPLTDRMDPPRPHVQDNLEQFTEHLVRFTLGGIHAMKHG
ncbi:TetR/AcrR family transcriptional regulator [Pseudodesulfovibrio senegalensis]|jgi:AcrR family transcriptional regulator|uniref:Helix-turn-helix transcriptional regulator n=1 Tax=Pseudodesulfovibrio senegalensis TaxID=1721087 RepID=A0A6N6N0R9_9BACT|nr:TetR/AcrR family transcriptional regulator [Pseudodesulfovibrio senegalensis]KAB1441477.1 helix-turn-helix transcriptional regulator [Pseudodesulfovibrio senegalensis]